MTVSKRDHDEAKAKMQHYVTRARELYGCDMSRLELRIDIRGFNIAGQAVWRHGQEIVRLNPKYFQTEEARNHIMNDTIGHEVAHHVARHVFSDRGHGAGWKRVMVAFGLDPQRCHNVDVGALGKEKRKVNRFEYACGCKTHYLTARVHNRIADGRAKYSCRACRQELVRVKRTQLPVAAQTAAPKKTEKAAAGTKAEQVQLLIKQNPGVSREAMLNLIMEKCKMSKAGAQTYYYKYKT